MIWTQRNGTEIHVRNMDYGHLVNTIRMLHRAIKRTEARGIEAMLNIGAYMPNGEMAQLAVEQAIDDLANRVFHGIRRKQAMIRRMAGELINRDLESIT